MRDKQNDQYDQLRQYHANSSSINATNQQHSVIDSNALIHQIPNFTKKMNSLVQATGANHPNDVILQPPSSPPTFDYLQNQPQHYHNHHQRQHNFDKHSTLPSGQAANSPNMRSIYDNLPLENQTYNRMMANDHIGYQRNVDESIKATRGADRASGEGRNKDEPGNCQIYYFIYIKRL